MTEKHKPVIGITLGDFNGIGPEVILKSLEDPLILNQCVPVIYGSNKVISHYRKLLSLDSLHVFKADDVSKINPKKINLISCFEADEVQAGSIHKEAGEAALSCLEKALNDIKNNQIEALVTGPIQKSNMPERFTFRGHTDYLAHAFNKKDSLMLMVGESLRVGVLTAHIPLKEVPQNISKEKLNSKLDLLLKTLKNDFGINKPKIAVLGVNPHAGEEGLMGKEEVEIIAPLIKEWKQKHHLVYGPFPADGFFGMMKASSYDAVLAMYHDQGLIPFKTLAFDNGVNFTAGLPIIRTSPDHGTAMSIAGKNIADASSMRHAIYLAIDLVKIKQAEPST